MALSGVISNGAQADTLALCAHSVGIRQCGIVSVIVSAVTDYLLFCVRMHERAPLAIQ